MLVVQLKIMMLVFLLSWVLFGALTAQAKVVQSFQECSEFFYNGQEPTGMDQNAIKICQKYGYYLHAHPAFYFATLYSSHRRMPVYSAYLCNAIQQNARSSRTLWFIEPQISGYNNYEMSLASEFNITVIKEQQAINDDYKYTGYDRGHLNPNSFQRGVARVATFTLTNAAPMDACFNRVHWKEWESQLLQIIQQRRRADYDAATAYLVTGTVPNQNFRIPQQGEFDEDDAREFNRVTVPTHVWTALCYKHPTDDSKSFSLGYIGQNQPDSNIRVMTVQEMNSILRDLYAQNEEINIFADDCFSTNQRSKEARSTMYQKIQQLQSNKLKIPPNVLNSFQTMQMTSSEDLQSSSCPAKRPRVNNTVITMSFEDASTFFKLRENMAYFTKSACLLTKVIVHELANNCVVTKRSLTQKRETLECQQVLENTKYELKTAADGTPCMSSASTGYCVCDTKGPVKIVHDELRKRALGQISRSVQCKIIPEQQSNVEETTEDVELCKIKLHYCETKEGFKSYCTAPCLYQKELKDYYCYSGQTRIPCSPQYSLITAEGEKCTDDHPCATYGYDYYWCWRVSGSWDYCSPPLPESVARNGKKCRTNHACAKYTSHNHWCYTDYDNNWDYCCTHNDSFSAVDGKTCKSDHPCGYHSEKHLWCNTTDGSKKECCVEAKP